MKVSVMWRSSSRRRFPIGPSYVVFTPKTTPWWSGLNGLRVDLPGSRVMFIEFRDAYRSGPFYRNSAKSEVSA